MAAAGGGREISQQGAAPSPRDVPGLKEQNFKDGWLPADDPAAAQPALAEVRLAEMPSR